ncbi:AAA family ATPase [Romboutsia lituseburensis]|uniref:AAA family ATPase n=1 Tax=Romboutsia lituseburensis TaxID=1537 RepID=UPI00215ADE16|nr:AAA family ATPase [Romboutsia lituseburensis]MCR8747257.1 AAA family ATPase [Romboutsia lituseburensis]
MLKNGYMYGLLKGDGSYDKDVHFTDVYKTIKARCNSNFEDIELYYDIVEQQLEKVYFSSIYDRERDKKRSQYRLYPLFLLYKVLIEIGKITGEYKITKDEYLVFVCTTEKYENYLDTVFNIVQYRNLKDSDQSIDDKVKEIAKRFKDVRYNRLLNVLKTINEIDKGYEIDSEHIEYVKEKVYLYETSTKINDDYVNILTSLGSMLKDDEEENDMNKDILEIPENKIEDELSRNLIIYGAPGTGKSHSIEEDRKKYFDNEMLYSRVTFNPNYAYYDFVGAYKPSPIYIKKKDDEDEYYKSNMKDKLEYQMMPSINYSFVPGPFVDILCRALNNPNHNFLLIIEEINRADAAAVFGDIFQLLDRQKDKAESDYGCSTYGITLGKDAMDYLTTRINNESNNFKKDESVKIPRNLYIWCTMNSADQNVNRMDTAFKRRWEFKYIDINSFKDEEEKEGIEKIGIKFKLGNESIDVKWNDFRVKLNETLEEIEVGEDKFIGPYFITDVDENNYILEDAIKYKLLMYLKDDVLRYNSTDLLRENYSFGSLLKDYEQGKAIFNENFIAKLKSLKSKGE